MTTDERTRDLYEVIPGFPTPPLVPLPRAEDLRSIGKVGLEGRRAAGWILKTVASVAGFREFQERLPPRLEYLLRRCNLRGPAFLGPVISATVALQDDPRSPSPTTRAATLVLAARSLYEEVRSGKLPPDRHRGEPLEMGQYPNLFSTSLVFEGKRARVFKSTNRSRMIAVVAGRFHALELGEPASKAGVWQLSEALGRLADANRPKRAELSPGLLTCATATAQRKAFLELEKTGINREALALLRHSFLTLCLDLDKHPSSHAEAAFLAHSANYANRWYNSSLQLVVFGNARACAIFNFDAYLDGNTMMRAASEIQRRGATYPASDQPGRDSGRLCVTELPWAVDGRLIQRAEEELGSIQDDQPATFELQGLGSSSLAAHNVQPVAAFVLALQMTANRLAGRIVRITQFLSMSRYRCMGVATAEVTTPEVIRFVEYVNREDMRRDQARVLLRDAIESQILQARKARRHLPPDMIFSLFIRSGRGIRGLLARWTFMFLRRFGLLAPAHRDVLVSHPATYPGVAFMGRPGIRLPYVACFGLHYHILENKTVVTVMPSVRWRIPNTALVASLRKDLQRVQSMQSRPGETKQNLISEV